MSGATIDVYLDEIPTWAEWSSRSVLEAARGVCLHIGPIEPLPAAALLRDLAAMFLDRARGEGMSETTSCDVCRADLLDDSIRYRVDRWDELGYVDHLDICSPPCLAVAATKDAKFAGAQENHEAFQAKLARAPKKVREWWNA